MPAPAAPGNDAAIARAFVDLQRVLDRIRRGELEASPAERERLTGALDALRVLSSAA